MPLQTPPGTTWLLCAAAPGETRAILEGLDAPGASVADAAAWAPIHAADRIDLLLTGVGKAAAAGAVAHVVDPARHAGVICLGVAGALPGSALEIGDAVAATESVYADEGVIQPDRFIDLATMGFPPGPPGDDATESGSPMGVTGDPRIRTALEEAGATLTRGRIATVSTCSGTDAHARHVVARTGAIAEAMEGAAIGFTLRRLAPALPFAEIRAISNTTGDRALQRWDLTRALRTVRSLASLLADVL